MKMLAFDTSTPYASLALWDGDQCIYDATCALGRRHSERLFDAFAHALSMVGWQREALDAVAVGIGPGSFTGLRVGVATAQGLAFALDCPLYGVNSLDALALSAPAGPALLAASIDARKHEIYVGLYRRGAADVPATGPAALPAPVALAPTRLLKPQALVDELVALDEPVLFLGSGAVAYRELFADALGARMRTPLFRAADIIRGADIAFLAAQQAAAGLAPAPFEIVPLYIRPSEAEMFIGPPEGGPPLAERLAPDGSIRPATAATSDAPIPPTPKE